MERESSRHQSRIYNGQSIEIANNIFFSISFESQDRQNFISDLDETALSNHTSNVQTYDGIDKIANRKRHTDDGY